MELATNITWFVLSCLLLGLTWRAQKARELRVSVRAAFTCVALLCMLLLPVISMTDDLLEHRQAALPLAAQTWHLASNGASVGIELLSSFAACVLLLFAPLLMAIRLEPELETRPHSAWLLRSLRLRPPPATTH